MRANRRTEAQLEEAPDEGDAAAEQLAANDIVLGDSGDPVAGIIRFHNALRELIGRRGIRDDVSRYEAVAIALVDMLEAQRDGLLASYPPAAARGLFRHAVSPLRRALRL